MCTASLWVNTQINYCYIYSFYSTFQQLKLKYFQQRHWAQDWIETAETIVQEEFKKYDTHPTLGPILSVPEVDDIEATTNFLNIPMDSLKEINELDNYISQAIEKVTDPIKWWWDHWKVFPKLSAMAFDFLSVPGMLYVVSYVFV